MTFTMTCPVCAVTFQTPWGNTKYCEGCRHEAKLASMRAKHHERREQQRAEYRTTAPPVRPAQRRLPVLRARTLAETPDVPALATRGDQLTGAAPAMNHGASVGMISVGV